MVYLLESYGNHSSHNALHQFMQHSVEVTTLSLSLYVCVRMTKFILLKRLHCKSDSKREKPQASQLLPRNMSNGFELISTRHSDCGGYSNALCARPQSLPAKSLERQKYFIETQGTEKKRRNKKWSK